MKQTIARLLISVAACLLPGMIPAAEQPGPTPELTVNFTNNSGTTTPVYIGFFAGKPTAGEPAIGFQITNNKDSSPIQTIDHGIGNADPILVDDATGKGKHSKTFPGTWYTLDQLSKGVTVFKFSGRVYVCYGANGWRPTYSGYEPAQTTADPNYKVRYDKIEMTFTGGQYDVADLTSIDYWSIPMSLKVSGKDNTKIPEGQKTATGLKGDTTAQDIFTVLNALTDPPVSGLPGVKQSDGSFDPTPVSATVTDSEKFVRVIGPGSYPPVSETGDPKVQGNPVQPYDLLTAYLTALQAGELNGPKKGVIAQIAGHFGGVGEHPTAPNQMPQDYDLTASIDADLNLTLSGNLTPASGVKAPVKMVFSKSALIDPAGIYGGNAKFSLNGAAEAAPGNDVYGWISGDLLSGLNIGAVGSKQFGAQPSSAWFDKTTGVKPDQAYAKLQPTGKFYNQWGASLQPLSDAYNFAYSDRFAAVFVTLNSQVVDTLEIVLDPAAVTP